MKKMSVYNYLYLTGVFSLIFGIAILSLVGVNLWNYFGPEFSQEKTPIVSFSDTITKQMVVYDTVVQKVVVKPKEPINTVVLATPQAQVTETPPPTLDTTK
jgi:hypothetical protein